MPKLAKAVTQKEKRALENRKDEWSDNYLESYPKSDQTACLTYLYHQNSYSYSLCGVE